MLTRILDWSLRHRAIVIVGWCGIAVVAGRRYRLRRGQRPLCAFAQPRRGQVQAAAQAAGEFEVVVDEQLGAGDVALAREHGAQGIAAIRALWPAPRRQARAPAPAMRR